MESYHGRTRRRAFFKSRAVAEAKAAQLRQDRDAFGRTWLELSTKERMEVCSVVEAARAKGVALADVWRAYEAGQVAGVKGSVTVEAALAAMLTAKRVRNLRENYLSDLARTVRQFAAGRMEALVREFTSADANGFVAQAETPGGRATRRGRLLAFFGFCAKEDWLTVNPMLKVERTRVDRERPEFLSVADCRRLVQEFEERHPRALGWLALALLAGIRPEEAAKVAWAQVDLEGGTVSLAAATHKTRKAHTVTLTPNALSWLIRAHEVKAELPISESTLRRETRTARKVMGWARWSKNVLRHTFCTYGVAMHGQAWTAQQADHSEAVLRRHYANQAKPVEAKEFFSIEPSALLGEGGEGAAIPARAEGASTAEAPGKESIRGRQ